MPDIKDWIVIGVIVALAVWVIQQTVSNSSSQTGIDGGPHNPEIPHGSHDTLKITGAS